MEFLISYFTLGIKHITDLSGYDHIVFVAVISCHFALKHITKLLYTITAFTVGHSITLSIAVLTDIALPVKLIESVIPATILISIIWHLFHVNDKPSELNSGFSYIMIAIFGLVHGWGFSGYLKGLLGNSVSVWQQLLAFNIGIEIGQLLIVAAIMFIGFILIDLLRIKRRDFRLGILCASGSLALVMFIERIIS